MNTNLSTLFDDLMALCESNEAFYFVDQKMGDTEYRIFTYRLASFTDFQNRNAVECRGHTFRKDADGWKLASLPPSKFFNYSEHVGWKTDIDLNSTVYIMDKLDGSLISTVEANDYHGAYFLKSKASFYSKQAVDAGKWLNGNTEKAERLRQGVNSAVMQGWTVNMEWLSADNQIVVGYDEQRLVVLNARHMETGEYMDRESMIHCFGEENIVQSFDIPDNMEEWLVEAEKMTGIEGFVICFANGLWVKHKTESYVAAHGIMSNLNTPRRLYELIVSETIDDYHYLFSNNEYMISRIEAETARIRHILIELQHVVETFYNENKDLERKDYAILAQERLPKHVMGLVMNMFLGKDISYKDYMLSKYDLFKSTVQESVQLEE